MQEHRPPGLLRRLAAMLYDTFLVLPLIMAAVAVATMIAVAVTGERGNDYSATLNPYLVQALALGCVMLFFGYFWRLKGQTLGMQAWRLRLRSLHGDRVSRRQVVLRCLGACLSMAAFGAGYLWCLADRNGRSWHDYLSGTELELLPKQEKKQKKKQQKMQQEKQQKEQQEKKHESQQPPDSRPGAVSS
jgi:uncharacterized RDD family membrane protein YckC